MVSPTVAPSWSPVGSTVASLSSDTETTTAAGIVTVDGSDGGDSPPRTPVPVAVAVSVTWPASTSPCVTVCGVSAVQVSEPPGTRDGDGVGQLTGPPVGSLIATDARLTFPVFVTR